MGKRILAITYYSLPVEAPGSFRVDSFAKWLPSYGYEVDVIAPGWHLSTPDTLQTEGYIKAHLNNSDASPVGRVYYLPIEPFLNEDEQWRDPLSRCFFLYNKRIVNAFLSYAKYLHKTFQYDLLLVSSPPQISMVAAGARISEALGIPFIVDKRDVLYQLDNLVRLSLRAAPLKTRLGEVIRIISRQRARKIKFDTELCNKALFTITVSKGLADIMRSRGVNNVEEILNGYEEEEFNIAPIREMGFNIQYFGSIYPEADLTPLIDGVELFLQNNQNAVGKFFVTFMGWNCKARIANERMGIYGRNVILAKDAAPKKEAIARMLGSDILLHLSLPRTTGIFTSKLSEYIGACKPILSIPGDGDVVDSLIYGFGVGQSLSKPLEIAAFLGDAYRLWESGSPLEEKIDKTKRAMFSRRIQAEHLAHMIDEYLSG